jgi:hypothetical protein
MRWAVEEALNPTVLRIHLTGELTTATIVTCPPATAPAPLDRLVAIDGVRSIDLHRYRVRLNLAPGAGRETIASQVTDTLRAAWGDPSELLPEELPRAFAVEHLGPRRVAESLEMAVGDPFLTAAFGVDGVAEAIAAQHLVLVKLGVMFRWADVGPAVGAALDAAGS